MLRTAKLTVGLLLEEKREKEQTRKVTLDPSAICEDGTDEGTQGVVVRGHRSRLAGVAGEEGGQGGPGDPPTVGLTLVQQPRGEDKKIFFFLDNAALVVTTVAVMKLC